MKIHARLGRILVGILLLVALAACTPAAPGAAPTAEENSAAGDTASAPSAATAPIEIVWRVYSWPVQGELGLMAQQVEKFNQEHPDIKVTTEVIDDWENLLMNDIAAGKAPDVVYYEGSMAQPLIEQGYVRKLNDWFDVEAFKADTLPDYWHNFLAVEDDLYALYNDTETRGVYYRADWMKEAGIEAPANGWTYADLRAAAKALTNADHAGVCIGKEGFVELGMIVANGYDYPNTQAYDDPAVRSLYQFYRDLIDDGSAMAEQAGLTRDNCIDLFKAGKTAMIFAHNNMGDSILKSDAIGEDNTKLGFVSAPVAEAGQQFKAVGGGFLWIVLEKAYDPAKAEAIKEFLTYMTDMEQMVNYAMPWGFQLTRLSYQQEMLDRVNAGEVDPVVAPYWPIWLEVAAQNVAPSPRTPNNMVFVQGLAQGVEAIQSGSSVDEAVQFATDYFSTNKN